MKVTVFGGAGPKPGDPAYLEALELGRELAQAGHSVLTGGYIGTMEAVSRGAAEAGGHVIGVTCDEIETWRAVSPNAWVQEEWRYPSLRQRLFALMDHCDAGPGVGQRCGHPGGNLYHLEPPDHRRAASPAAGTDRPPVASSIRPGLHLTGCLHHPARPFPAHLRPRYPFRRKIIRAIRYSGKEAIGQSST